MASDQIQSPFLEARSFTSEESDVTEALLEAAPPLSPFLSEYQLDGMSEATDPKAEAYMNFLNELYDEEFDEALFELFTDASSLTQDRFVGEQYERDEVERMLEQRLEPLLHESEAMLDTFAGSQGERDLGSYSERDLETFESLVDQYSSPVELNPSFEQFFGKLKKMVKKVARGAVNLAKKGIVALGKLGLGPILKKLKALIKPLLKRVLKFAINKLPSNLRPLAQKLAERLPFLKEVEEAEEEDQQENDASPDVTELQQEFNQQVTNLLFASSEVEQEFEVAQAINEAQAPGDSALSTLDMARERFINELSQLKEGEDPTPYLENFIPAILPALKLGLRLVGRQRVVNLLAGPLAKLIRKFIGPQHAPALSRALVDVGLRLMHLEVTPQDEARAAPAAVAATVEDTVRQVAALPEYVLNDSELLAGYTLEAFEQAAAVNLPPVLPEAVYRERPDLLEAEGVRGCWLPMPLRGPKRYKKFSRTFKVTVTPHKAMVVQTFGETMLADFLQDQLGLPPGAEVEAEMHLYESLPGTTLPELARLEEATPGLGSSTEQATAQLHPLTPEAAGLLLGEPGLGRPSSPRYISDRRTIGVGQRFYHLAIPGRRPLMVPESRGRARIRRPLGLRATLNFPADHIRVYLFLSESRAQDLAGKLRKQVHPGVIVKDLNRVFKWRLPAILSGRLRGRVKIVHETLTPEQALGGGLRRLPGVVLETLSKKLLDWLIGSEEVKNFFKLHAQRVIAASEDPRDGITLIFTVLNPPGFPQLRQTLRGKVSATSGLSPEGGVPKVQVDVVPGYYHG